MSRMTARRNGMVCLCTRGLTAHVGQESADLADAPRDLIVHLGRWVPRFGWVGGGGEGAVEAMKDRLFSAMPSIDIVALVAVMQYLVFGGLVARARVTYGVKAPAVSGHERFERLYRVQMNTLELLVAFLPALYLAAQYWPAWAVTGLGGVYVVGRVIYWRAYVRDPSKRSLGFLLSGGPIFVMVLATLVAALARVL